MPSIDELLTNHYIEVLVAIWVVAMVLVLIAILLYLEMKKELGDDWI